MSLGPRSDTHGEGMASAKSVEQQDCAGEDEHGGDWPALVDAAGCAAMLSISVNSWYRLLRGGLGPKPLYLGRLSRWRVEDVVKLAARLPSR